MGNWRHRARAAEHRRVREAMLAAAVPGETLCARCKHALEEGDRVQADHDDQGDGYLGLSHSSPCRICGRRCNQAAGGERAALLAGKRLRSRACVVCGKNFVASRGSDGSVAATCGQRACLTELRRVRRAHEPDPRPPPQTGRAW